MSCAGCDKDFRAEDLAPYQRNVDGSYSEACRKCIGEWIKLGILWPVWPFWARKEGLDKI
jgi:hypothetical protein